MAEPETRTDGLAGFIEAHKEEIIEDMEIAEEMREIIGDPKSAFDEFLEEMFE